MSSRVKTQTKAVTIIADTSSLHISVTCSLADLTAVEALINSIVSAPSAFCGETRDLWVIQLYGWQIGFTEKSECLDLANKIKARLELEGLTTKAFFSTKAP